MSVDFKMFKQVVPAICAARFPILLRGRHGIGKSMLAYELAHEMGMEIIERRASQMTEGDLIGLPVISGNTTKWNPPDWFKAACDKPVVLFFDEVDRATTEVRQGLFELTDSRKLNGHRLHPDTLIFAAVNGGKHGAQYQVADMDPAELDRYTVFDVEPTVEDWTSWAKGKVPNLIVDFILGNPKHLEHNGDIEPNKVYPSRRSWDRFGKTVGGEKGLLSQGHSPALYTIAASFLGMEAGVAFNDFVQNYNKQISVEDLLQGKLVNRFKEMEANTILVLIEKLEASGKLDKPLSKKETQSLADMFVRIPSEISMKLLVLLGTRATGELQSNLKALYECKTIDGITVQERTIAIISSPEIAKESK